MTAIVVEWMLRPETLAWTSLPLLVLWTLRPIGQYLDREAAFEGEIDFSVRGAEHGAIARQRTTGGLIIDQLKRLEPAPRDLVNNDLC